ncbi:MAG TPA: A24 family peptidase [Candidatus Dormibacteraeota bacterium]|nr:A24 family peptidase [Candidatus Dormibacteraeota bacterium]
MSSVLLAVGWAVLGAAVGIGLNYLSRQLARLEEIEFEQRRSDKLLMPLLNAALFFAFALKLGMRTELLIDSVYVAILVQVLAFDLKTRYILDLVMFPAWLVAFALAFVTPWDRFLTWPWPDWRTAPVAAAIAGLTFLLLYVGGQLIFGAEAFGFGDVKLAVFIGMATGLSNLRMAHALIDGVFLGGFVAVVLLVFRIRSLKEAVPYGPFLALGTVATLFIQPP